ncbi:DNA glycosylase AlkZ-like family protein [Actinokineospora sp. NPDC004072]
MELSRAQVLAHRIARHGLHREVGAVVGLGVLDLGVQDSAAGARVALAARLPDVVGVLPPEVVLVWAQRGAPHLVRRGDVAGLAGALYPRGDADAAARLGTVSARSLRAGGVSAAEGFAVGAAALRAVVDGEKPRAQVSAEMTALLPPAYSYDCRACGSTHVFGSLFQLVGIAAGVEVVPETRPARLRPLPDRHPLPTVASDPGGLVAAYLRLHGPASPADLAGFLGTTRAVAVSMWPGDLVAVTVEGRPAQLPAADVDAVRAAPDARELVRLLPPADPLLQGRDREVLVPDAARRKQVWRAIGSPGVLLAEGEVAGTWRTRVPGARLEVAVELFSPIGAAARGLIGVEADRVARARGLREARVTLDNQILDM